MVPLLRRAGAETQLVVLANGLSKDRFDKFLLSYRPGDDLKDDINTDEIEVFELERDAKIDLNVCREIGHIIDERRIDVVHCTLQNALLFGYLATRFAKREPKLIASLHTTKNANFKLDLADTFVYRPVLNRCDQVWFVSSQQARLWIKKMPFLADKARTVHNGVDLDLFEPSQFVEEGAELRRSLGIGEQDKVLCSVAGFREEKLHDVLIDAMHILSKVDFRCHLLLAGAGPLESSLRDQVSKTGLDDYVHFLGSLPDVRGVLAASDAKALVSAAETFSMAMLESMAMQTPVITTSVGGASEAINTGDNGILLKPGNARALADAIRSLLEDDDKRLKMGEKARAIVERDFTEAGMIERSAVLLESI